MPSPPPEANIIRSHSGTQDAVGYVIELYPEQHEAACWLDVGPRHLNKNDLLHGGYVTMLLDVACGHAASLALGNGELAPLVTVTLTTNYAGPGRAGRVRAKGRVTGGGRTLCYASGELRDEAGAVIATATGVFRRISKGSAGG